MISLQWLDAIAALAMLDEKSRFVFVETEFNGKSYKQLSELTGEPIGTLLSRKNRAVKKLCVMMENYNNNGRKQDERGK